MPCQGVPNASRYWQHQISGGIKAARKVRPGVLVHSDTKLCWRLGENFTSCVPGCAKVLLLLSEVLICMSGGTHVLLCRDRLGSTLNCAKTNPYGKISRGRFYLKRVKVYERRYLITWTEVLAVWFADITSAAAHNVGRSRFCRGIITCTIKNRELGRREVVWQ